MDDHLTETWDIIDSPETVKSVDEPSYQTDFLPRFSRSPRQSWRSSKRDRNQARGINIEMNWFPSHYLSWRGEDASTSETRFVYSVRVSIEARRGMWGGNFCACRCVRIRNHEKPSQNLRSLRGCNPRSGSKYSRSFYEVNSSLRSKYEERGPRFCFLLLKSFEGAVNLNNYGAWKVWNCLHSTRTSKSRQTKVRCLKIVWK